jgi:hypothetical protein
MMCIEYGRNILVVDDVPRIGHAGD